MMPIGMLGIRRMQAAILVEQHRPLVVDEVELPAQLDVGQVLVRIAVSGICGSQIGEIDGAKGPDRFLPHLLGHEGSGTVEATGPGVRRLKTGDLVVLHWRRGPGIEAVPAAYRWHGSPLNAGWVTTLGEYAVVSENRLTPVPHDTDPEVASLLGCPLTTGYGIVTREARLTLGETIVVLGTGGVGLAVVQAAALAGAAVVVAVDLHDAKLRLARRLGATHVVDGSSQDLVQAVRAIVGAEGADVVVENTGRADLIRAAYDLTAADGRAVLAGVPRYGEETSIPTLPLHFGKTLTGSHGGATEPDRDIPRYLRLAASGRADPKALVTDRIALEGVNEAIERLRRGAVAGRCVVTFPR
jgi:S-(hydroxymethyl)glutathione dehydrogenase / alcohol dehydrogenase